MKEANDVKYRQAMQNAYILLTNKLSLDEVLDHNGCALPFSIEEDVTDEDVEGVIEYFCKVEEFEKCAELKKLKETQKYNKNFINL